MNWIDYPHLQPAITLLTIASILGMLVLSVYYREKIRTYKERL